MMREIITRYGREGLGFLWLIAEPLLFCFGVIIMWSFIKPEYEHGVRLGPFVMTGYMSLLLMRHQIGYCLGALQANVGLLHHRQVSVLAIYISRTTLEFMGTTGAFVVVYVALIIAGQVTAPKDWILLYFGWLLLGWMSMGMAILLSALAMRFEMLERIVQLFTYVLIPVSGAFFMVAWLPDKFQEAYLLIPLPHGIEMLRAGVFGEFVETHHNGWYALICGFVMNFAALVLLAGARDRIDIE